MTVCKNQIQYTDISRIHLLNSFTLTDTLYIMLQKHQTKIQKNKISLCQHRIYPKCLPVYDSEKEARWTFAVKVTPDPHLSIA